MFKIDAFLCRVKAYTVAMIPFGSNFWENSLDIYREQVFMNRKLKA